MGVAVPAISETGGKVQEFYHVGKVGQHQTSKGKLRERF